MTSSIDVAYRLPADEVIGSLGADTRRGLSDAEARTRLARDGLNELAAEPPVPGWRKFLAQFQDILVVLLLIAAAMSAAVWFFERDSSVSYEALAIFAIVLLNAAIGFIQEERAEAAVAALRALSAEEASVIRGGERKRVPAGEL